MKPAFAAVAFTKINHLLSSSEFQFEFGGVAAANGERLALVLQIKQVSMVKLAFEPLDAFEIDHARAMNQGEMFFGHPLFPFAKRLFGEKFLPFNGKNFRVVARRENVRNRVDFQKKRARAAIEKKAVVVFERARRRLIYDVVFGRKQLGDGLFEAFGINRLHQIIDRVDFKSPAKAYKRAKAFVQKQAQKTALSGNAQKRNKNHHEVNELAADLQRPE